MAPIPLIDVLARDIEVSDSTPLLQHLQTRDLPPQEFVGTLIALFVLASLVFVAFTLVVGKVWSLIIQRYGRGESARSKQSDLAAQNNIVIWSTHMGDDDLRSHFAAPSRLSRLFSIGSLSSEYGRCPLDQSVSPATGDHSPAQLVDEKKTEKGIVEVVEIPEPDDLNSEKTATEKMSLTKAKARSARKSYRLRCAKSLENIRRVSISLKELVARKDSMPVYYKRLYDEED
ncbi:hypothetical protein PV08_05556 [Exophiala spinifera]|uniref:Uncharacterized protein n=1 Tax=Exophiala spinifera TaxID=91928 RepID=A0A0D2BAE0_9EURO|nr:uncharacterized protein PV08_05556 [Exophiala spinifera]KIW15510.1 hypothetical protein PV08_05556 [Exophiala spinifera]